jgi:hypothetical protein
MLLLFSPPRHKTFPACARCLRSRASSPEWGEPHTLDDRRLTARQRARLEKEAGLAEDLQWHEMAMPAELAYTWKGKGACRVRSCTCMVELRSVQLMGWLHL